jgi:hypothetical protein
MKTEIFLIYEEIQMGSVAKSYIRKGFQINEEMRKYLTIYEEAVGPYTYMMENLIFFFIIVRVTKNLDHDL